MTSGRVKLSINQYPHQIAEEGEQIIAELVTALERVDRQVEDVDSYEKIIVIRKYIDFVLKGVGARE